jgi:peptide/nickel transport system substrate-binding protein
VTHEGMMRRVRRASTCLAFLLIAAGCQQAERADTVVYASGADLESADPVITIHPMARQVQRHALFVTLLKLDSALNVQPYYAREWAWSADQTQLRLRLEPTLRWHDGEPTTSADVAFTLDRVRDPAAGSPRQAELAQLAGWEIHGPNEMTLKFRLPQPAMPNWLAELPVVPRHLLGDVPPHEQRRAGFGTVPVGNGPYRFVHRDRGERWIFEANEEFPRSMGGPPAVRRFVVVVVDEATTKFAGLVSGELHVAGISPGMAGLVRQDPGLELRTYPVLFTTALIFNPARPPFNDVRVRRAFDMAVDRERIIRVAFSGLAAPAGGPVAPDNPMVLGLEPRFDPEQANALLEEAGWTRASGERWRSRDGVQLTVELLTVGSADNAVEQLIQDDLADIGVRMEIRQLEMGSFLSIARAPDKRFDMLITGVPGDLSLSYLAAMFESRLAGGALDYAGYHTPALDSAFAEARTATSEMELRNAWTTVQRILDNELPVAWLIHSRGVQGVSSRLQGVHMDLRGELATLSEWRLRQ